MSRYDRADPGFDPRIADWLDADAREAPGEVLEAVLAAFPSIRQRRAMRMPRRFLGDRFARMAAVAGAAAIAAILAVTVSGLLGSPRPSGGPSFPAIGSGGPSPSPTTPSPEPTATATRGPMWTPTGTMVEIPRYGESATLLPNGDVLVAGGKSDFGEHGVARATAELFDPAAGRWILTGSMHVARWQHVAVLLPSGHVLVAGGFATADSSPRSLKSAELFDPTTGIWTVTGSMTSARTDATATLLPDGKVLVAGGGYANGPERSAEIYDPVSGIWTEAAPMIAGRANHTATLLSDGEVLVAGGGCCGTDALASAELFDPASGTWARTGMLAAARRSHTAILLTDGRVLVYGGDNYALAQTTAELYDPATGTWEATGNPRNNGAGVRLLDGRVFVKLSSAPGELYDPATGSWNTVGGPTTGWNVHSATLLADGRVLVIDTKAAALFDPSGTP
jgi:hypothetical protein